jgi:BASS family bile acid:Na+ symporter
MTYLARGNLALSIALTSIATLVAPIMTPFMMKILAGQLVPVSFVAMMLSMVKMIVVPIALAVVVNALFRDRAAWLIRIMPNVSIAALVAVLCFITASGRDALLTMGLLLMVAVVLHNSAGLLLGYWGGRLLGMDERDSRTLAIEVGMQNGGLAGGIAVEMGRAGTMGLAAAVFSSWHNISGSVLANWWRNRPTGDDDLDEQVSSLPEPTVAGSNPA